MLVPMSDLLQDALKNNYAVAAPNVWNEWTTKAAIDTAERLNSPLILDYAYTPNVYVWMSYAKQWSEAASVPIAINLDHGSSFEQAINCIHAGFTSIMVDRSEEILEKNISDVAELGRIAHVCGVTVEAELGFVGHASSADNENEMNYTDPSLAKKYVDSTNVDCLAVSIGNAHGKYNKGKVPKIRFDILESIQEKIDIPLVLHGGSGTSSEDFSNLATKTNICKVNLFTDLHDFVKEEFVKINILDGFLTEIDDKGYEFFSKKLEEHMILFNSVNKAKILNISKDYLVEGDGIK